MGCLGIWRHPKLHLEASKRMHIKRGCTVPLSHARCGQAHILSPVTSATGGGWKNFLASRVSSRCPEYLHLESGCEEPRGQAPSSRQHPGLPGALPVPRLAGPHEGPSRCHLPETLPAGICELCGKYWGKCYEKQEEHGSVSASSSVSRAD